MGESGLQLALQQIYWPVDRNKAARNLTQKARPVRGDRQQRQAGRQALHSTCLLVLSPRQWLLSSELALNTPFHASLSYLLSKASKAPCRGRHMQSQAAILGVSAHFVFFLST